MSRAERIDLILVLIGLVAGGFSLLAYGLWEYFR
jgi:hypothetical protein